MFNSTSGNFSNFTDELTTRLFFNKTQSSLNWQHIILSSISCTFLIGLIIFGNALVIIAIGKDKNLKSFQNWFIASLAVSDILVGLLVMPLSLVNQLLGYWPFGTVMCDLWLATDVLFSTASILNLVLISLDRYWSITKAMTYVRQRTKKRVMLMITAVWTSSMVICFPPLAGWKRPQKITNLGQECSLTQDIGYILYSTLGSFYIPLIVMIIVYFKIYLAARARARRALKKKKQNQLKNLKKEVQAYTTDRNKLQVPNAYGDDLSSPSANDSEGREIIKMVSTNHPIECSKLLVSDSDSACDSTGIQKIVATNPKENPISEESDFNTQNLKPLLEKHTHFDHKVFEKKKKIHTIFGRKKTEKKLVNEDSGKSFLEDPERAKKKLARARERRAIVVLGIVMFTFIFCWLPFFLTYLISSIFKLDVPKLLFDIFFWAGYTNSALNPIIYTIFNQDFRNAFKRLLCSPRKHH